MKGSETVLLPDVGHGFSKTNKWAPQFRQAFRKIVGEDRPDTARRGPRRRQRGPGGPGGRRPAARRGARQGAGGKTLAVMISGDGGWAGIDKDVSKALSAKGIPVVGWNSLQYFWTARKPDAAARDLERILRHYLAVWSKQEVLLIGYSFGADVLPFFANRLPADLLEQVRLVALLGPARRPTSSSTSPTGWAAAARGSRCSPRSRSSPGTLPSSASTAARRATASARRSPPPSARPRCCRAPTTSEGTTTPSPR